MKAEEFNWNELFTKFSSNKIILIILIIAIMFLVTKIIKKFLGKLSEKYTSKRIVIKKFIPIVNIVVNLSGVFFIFFGILRISKETLIPFGVSAGVAVGFALQNILGSVFGGLIIIFTRPVNIGDKILIGSYYGEVIDINLMKIKMVTPDDSVILIPTKMFLESLTSNSNSGELDCQVVTEMFLPGDVDIEKIKLIAYEAVYTSPYAFLKKPVVINFFDDFKETSLVRMKIKAYVKDHRFENRFSSDIYERIKIYTKQNNIIPTDFYRYK